MVDIFGALLVTFLGFWFSFLYYSPFLAGSEWLKAVGMDEPMDKWTEKHKKRMQKIFSITFLVNFLSFLGISYILYLMNPIGYDEVLSFSVIVWFICSWVGLIQSLFQNKNVYAHVLSTIDDAVRIIGGTSILYILM